MMQVPITELTWKNANDGGSVHVGMNYPKIPDSRYVALPGYDFLFPWEKEMGSTENPITMDEDEGVSETMTPQNTPSQQPHHRWDLV